MAHNLASYRRISW